jgi:hypothetical protein
LLEVQCPTYPFHLQRPARFRDIKFNQQTVVIGWKYW